MAIVYKTSSEQNRVFIPLKFDYEFNNPGFNTDDEFIEDYYEEAKMCGGLKVEIDSKNIWWWK